MGGSTSRLKKWMSGEEYEENKETYEKALRLATPFVYTRRG